MDMDCSEELKLVKKTKPNTRPHIDLRDASTTCPLFLGAHCSPSYLQKVKELVEASDRAYFCDPKGYGARPREATEREFECPMGSKLAGAAETMCAGGINADVGKAFIERLPLSVMKNVRAGAL